MASEVATVAVESFEAQIAKLKAELAARLTIDEARNRLLDALEGARQAHVQTFKGVSVNGDLFRNTPESELEKGVQVLSLPDFNAALDKAFPVAEEPHADE